MHFKTYFLYILATQKNGTLYIGITNNLKRRVYEHKQKLADSFTKKYSVNQVVYFEVGNDINNIIHRETCMKRWKRAWKIALIEKTNPHWQDLYTEI